MNTHSDITRLRRGRQGITLIEMMVALAITTFVILVVNQLFNSVTQTVTRGVQASELLQKAREMDQQLAFETELDNSKYDATAIASARYAQWNSRMVGPAGRNGTAASGGSPGGFLAIVQRVIEAPLTVEDGIQGRTRFIRSDQLMFVYDQDSPLDAGTKRLPAMAPSSRWSYTGDSRDSQNADYVRIWYGHVLQIPKGADPIADYNMNAPASYQDIDLGSRTGSGNPNILAQDWVLGRHALFLTDASLIPGPPPPPAKEPYGPHVISPFRINVIGSVKGNGFSGASLANGVADVANTTLEQLTGAGGSFNSGSYSANVLLSMFTVAPLLTAAKSEGTSGDMRTWDVSPSHTYFMGGVSDFIVEFAGDLANAQFTGNIGPGTLGPDGELDRDGQGRIKWYTALGGNPNLNPSTFDPDMPITQWAPPGGTSTGQYAGRVDLGGAGMSLFTRRADAAFVWRSFDGSPNFTQWPWMIRIRYRLHDRRGGFDGREITNNATGQKELEPGFWYETIIPVNYQGVP